MCRRGIECAVSAAWQRSSAVATATFAFVFLLFDIPGVDILLWQDIPVEYLSVNCLLFVFVFLLFSILRCCIHVD